jgi:hypothetical protein
MMVAIPFLAIVACLGLKEMVDKYFNVKLTKQSSPKLVLTGGLVALTWVTIIGFGLFNLNYFDVGRTLDPNLSTCRLYYQEFTKIPDGAIFMPNYAMEWEAIYKYNADYGKNIYPICMDILPAPDYRAQLRKDGIKFVDSTNPNFSIMGRETAQSIVAMNDNVWTTVSTIPETLQTDVVPANHDISLVEILTEEKLQQITSRADNWQFLWKPWNPYDIITNSISQEQWRNQLLSNWNVRLFVSLFLGGYFIMWLWERWSRKQREVDDEDTIYAEEKE